MKFTQLATVLSVLSSTSAFIVLSVGKCPNVPTKAAFDLSRYLGQWYSYENFDAPFQWGTTCVSANYRLKDNGRIRVLNDGFRDIRIFGRTVSRTPVTAIGEAYIVDQAVPGALKVSFGGQPDFGGDKANYLIIDTDYDNFSIVYSCNPLGFLKVEFAWILTRERGVRPSNRDNIMSNLRSYGINTKNFKRVDHSNC